MSVKLFVEGAADIKFLSDFATEVFNRKMRSTEFIDLNGWNGIENEKQKFIENSIDGVNLVILDADDDSNGGGFAKRKAEILALKELLGIEFELFLLPNNQINGDLETLLTSIINQDNLPILECWQGFENCITGLNKDYTIPARKTKIYAYLEVLLGKTKKEKERIKDKNRDFLNKNNWDLTSANLTYPLYQPHIAPIKIAKQLCHYGAYKYKSTTDNASAYSCLQSKWRNCIGILPPAPA